MALRRVLILTTAGILTMAAVAPALAESDDGERNSKDEMAAAMSAPITLSQAITAAEGATAGRAVGARYDGSDGDTVVKVELVKDQALIHVRVDAKSGQTLSKTTASMHEEHEEDDD